jgi:hypothetical protein
VRRIKDIMPVGPIRNPSRLVGSRVTPGGE